MGMASPARHAWLRRVSDYHDGDVSAAERAAVEAHLATCAECQEALAMYQRFYALLRSPMRLDGVEYGLSFVPDANAPLSATRSQEPAPRTVRPLIDTEPPVAPGLPPHRRPSARLTALSAVAALLVVALLAGIILTIRGNQASHPKLLPTPTPTRSAGIAEFPLPAGAHGPGGMAVGPDGNLWFTESVNDKIGRITPAGVVTEFPLPGIHSHPQVLAVSSDGTVWFLEYVIQGEACCVGRRTPGGAVTEFPLSPTSSPNAIVVGPDGNLWFTETGKIGRITPAGRLTEFALPPPGNDPIGITAGRDGNLWFTETAFGKIGRITPTGSITEFATATAGSAPYALTVGPDGNLWFTDIGTGKIGRMTPAGVATEFPTPSGKPQSDWTTPSSGSLQHIAAGSDGNLWFTEVQTGKIGRITPAGVAAEFPLPPGAQPVVGGGQPAYVIVAGPDGNLWFNEYSSDKIGRLDPRQVAPGA